MRILPWSFGVFCVTLLLSAGGIIALTAIQWSRNDPGLEKVLNRPGAVELFAREGGAHTTGLNHGRTPLLVQAEDLARHLNPPVPPTPVRPAPTPRIIPPVPAVHPVASSPKFRLRATCCHVSNREESRALVCEQGGDGRQQRWVKEGDRLGHFLVQEIRSGSMVCMNGLQRHELTVEPPSSRPSFVKQREPSAGAAAAAPVVSNLAAEVDVTGMDRP